jgi:hypothetical protein
MSPDILGLFTEVIRNGSKIIDGTIDFVKNQNREVRDDAWNKVMAITSAVDGEGNLMYPNAKKDLLQHYFASQGLADKVSSPVSLAVGLGKEIGDGGFIPFYNSTGNASGFSVDDLGANYAGATDMPFDEAYDRGMFTHTETKGNIKGYGQGEVSKVLAKYK